MVSGSASFAELCALEPGRTKAVDAADAVLAFETEEPRVLSFLELEAGTPKPEAVGQPPASDADLDALSVSAASPSLPPSPLPAGPSASEPVYDGPCLTLVDREFARGGSGSPNLRQTQLRTYQWPSNLAAGRPNKLFARCCQCNKRKVARWEDIWGSARVRSRASNFQVWRVVATQTSR